MCLIIVKTSSFKILATTIDTYSNASITSGSYKQIARERERESKKENSSDNNRRKVLFEFLNSLPKMGYHYRRTSASNLYLFLEWNSKPRLTRTPFNDKFTEYFIVSLKEIRKTYSKPDNSPKQNANCPRTKKKKNETKIE